MQIFFFLLNPPFYTEVLRERNDEGCNKSLVEFESIFFFTLYTWTAAFVALWELSFHNFLVIFSLPMKVFLLYTLYIPK
jgi:hypothetical protein